MTYTNIPNRAHYGRYGENCINNGQFDAGECSICKIKKILDSNNMTDAGKIILINRVMFDHTLPFNDEF